MPPEVFLKGFRVDLERCVFAGVALDDFEDSAEFPDADAGLVSEVKRLRVEAMKLHPDLTGNTDQESCRAFSAAWLLYERARDRMNKK